MKMRIFVPMLSLLMLSGVECFHWCSWSSCSATCGKGKQTRHRICGTSFDSLIHTGNRVQTKSCFESFCPSYLSWPRVHFSGTLVADVSTVNNFRCNYHNKYFTPNKWTTNYGANINYTIPPQHYKVQRTNWNPSGTGHAYFYNTTVKSICTEAGSCSTSDGIVGLPVTELSHGRMVDLDTDWQFSPAIWGLTVSIPAVLQGQMTPSPSQNVGTRLTKLPDKTKGYIYAAMGFYKTKLTNVTWLNKHYKATFKSSPSLSFTFVYDLYNQYSFDGRVSGTIGLTSDDDPAEMFAGRIMKSYTTTTYPFHLHEHSKILVLDLSTYFNADRNGLFNLDYGQLDVAMIVKTKDYCRLRRSYKLCMLKYGTKSSWYFYLTKNGAISQMVGDDSSWYLKYGGVMEVDLTHLKNSIFELLKRSRLTLLKKTYGSSTSVAVATEPIHGINVGIASSSVMRLNLNESSSYSTFASKYGKPAHNVTVSVKVADKYTSAFYSCNMPVDCNRSLSTPSDALQMLPMKCTIDELGLCNFNITYVKDPGPVRGCQMDGQVYPLNILWADYNHDGNTTKYMSGPTQSLHPGTHTSITQNTAVRIYNESPVKQCPTWEDVKYIFHQYHNLYPVMSQYGIINLMSYKDVRRKVKMLRVSMFETNITDARYMPTTRDMSRNKRQLIKNWMDCGMKKEPTNPKRLECNEETLNEQLNDTRVLLERAIMLELSTIPPYFTAWLSLKTQQGKNLQVAKIIQSVYREEMLHMTLVSNLLNAIGGKVVLSSLVQLPQYSTTLEFGEFFEILPDKRVTIEPMSIEVAQDVFSAIEKPASEDEIKLMANIAKLWKLLPKEGHPRDDSVTLTMNDFMKTHATSNNASESLNATLSWTRLKSTSSSILDAINGMQISTISSFYTKIALQLAFMESCTKSLHGKSNDASPTIFTGAANKQLNQSYWFAEYTVDDDDVKVVNSKPKASLFAVTDLKSALEAVVEVVHQGEGGSSCSPFVTSFHSKEYSHYYRFQEIVHGRKLIQVKQPPYWYASKCLNMTEQCPHLKQSSSDYCYLGKQITFDKDGVWPLISNPQTHMYDIGTKAHRLDHEFNKIYSRLLLCLEEAFNGNPNKLKACMSDMYSLMITGKKMVKTPIGIKGNSETVEIGQYEQNASPTWLFIPSSTSTAGLPFKK